MEIPILELFGAFQLHLIRAFKNLIAGRYRTPPKKIKKAKYKDAKNNK